MFFYDSFNDFYAYEKEDKCCIYNDNTYYLNRST